MGVNIRLWLFGQKSDKMRNLLLPKYCIDVKGMLKYLCEEGVVSYLNNGCVVFVNDELTSENRELKSGDEVKIVPMLHGG